jgi:thiol-disulfide isomerase/thioredoxin
MSHPLRSFCIAALLCCMAAAGAAPAAQKDKPKAAADKPAAKQPAAQSDPYAVPEGSVEELIQFIDRLKEPPAELTPQTIEEHRKKATPAILKAAEKVFAAKPNEQQAQNAARSMMIALAILEAGGDKEAGKRLESLPAELQKAGWPKLGRETRGFLLQKRLRQTSPEDVKEVEKMIADIKKHLAEAPVEDSDIGLILTAARFAEMTGKTELAVDAYTSFAKILAASKDERVAKLAKTMEGVVRRLTLVGNKMKVEGTILGGEALDWSKYAGKVVLVDFWASWCPPCVREMPNVKKVYEAYHDRGFEIVGISLDRSRAQLEEFLKANTIPWTIVYDDKAPSPTADYYGIMAIPTMILVGKDGKVLSTTARGPELREQLEKLLGQVEEEEKPKAKE